MGINPTRNVPDCAGKNERKKKPTKKKNGEVIKVSTKIQFGAGYTNNWLDQRKSFGFPLLPKPIPSV